jgi:phytol kinase
MISPWLGIALFPALLLGLLSLLRLYRRRCGAHPELVRKLLHVGMGLGTLTFPWLFHAGWPIPVLLSLVLLLLYSLRREGWLHAHFGGVLDGVTRETSGEYYFALGIAAIFLLARGRNLLFVIPVLLLTLADSSAALIGLRYGRHWYPVGNGEKSVEGSLACFLTGVFCVILPLRFFGGVGLEECLFIGLSLGALIMALESLAWGGVDNLLIPVCSWLVLRSLLSRDSSQWFCVLILLVVAIACFIARIRLKAAENRWVAPVDTVGGEG